ncbi:MAG: 4-hydroxy-3-methylbut-2-enyl diphosphate reductase [Holosporales bacterium]|nr:4-hydroxy-3-methylbut-2-enyl diphosphate reductase [Holosporales bacterium]
MSINCYLLQPVGFCSGVARAVDMAKQVLKLCGNVYIIEDIVHNKVLMHDMYELGIVKVSSLEEIPDGSSVMFSAHGVAPDLFDRAEEKGLTIIDGTCPVVKAVQLAVKEQASSGKKIIIIGKRTHPEVIALKGYAGSANAFIVFDEGDCDLLPDFTGEDVLYLTQTTLDINHVERIIRKLKERIPHISRESQNNICYTTIDRQAAIRDIANVVDLVIVLGSSYSANAKVLEAVAIDSNVKKVTRIDSEQELDLSLFSDVSSFAIATASSTPKFVLDRLLDFLTQNMEIEIKDFEQKID